MKNKNKPLSLLVGALALPLFVHRLFTPDGQVKATPDEGAAQGEHHNGNEQPRPDALKPGLPPAQPLENEPKPADGQAAGQSKKQEAKRRRARWSRAWLPVIFSGLTFVVILGQTYIYNKQWEAMLMQIDEAKSTREVENRAYVGVQSIDMNRPVEPDVEGVVTIVGANAGNTPAISFNRACQVYVSDSEPIGVAPFLHDYSEGFGTLAPGAEFIMECRIPAIPEKVLASTQIGLRRLFVVGTLTYQDIFRRPHKTNFCFYNVFGTTSLRPCTQANAFD